MLLRSKIMFILFPPFGLSFNFHNVVLSRSVYFLSFGCEFCLFVSLFYYRLFLHYLSLFQSLFIIFFRSVILFVCLFVRLSFSNMPNTSWVFNGISNPSFDWKNFNSIVCSRFSVQLNRSKILNLIFVQIEKRTVKETFVLINSCFVNLD